MILSWKPWLRAAMNGLTTIRRLQRIQEDARNAEIHTQTFRTTRELLSAQSRIPASVDTRFPLSRTTLSGERFHPDAISWFALTAIVLMLLIARRQAAHMIGKSAFR